LILTSAVWLSIRMPPCMKPPRSTASVSITPQVCRSLQAKGTRGAKRLLKRLSGHERRHMHHMNQTISIGLVETTHPTQRQSALEDLRGMRERMQSRKARCYSHIWAFYQLWQCVAYKAREADVSLVLV
jgi:hypothetical protein